MELHDLQAGRSDPELGDEKDATKLADTPADDSASDLPVTGRGDAAPESGVRKIEAIQAVWGPTYGKYVLWSGCALVARCVCAACSPVRRLAMMMIIFELDNATLYNYQPYATSTFNKQSLLAALQTMQTVVTAAAKPPIAKISDVIGRAEAYCICVTFYIICEPSRARAHVGYLTSTAQPISYARPRRAWTSTPAVWSFTVSARLARRS